MAMKPLKSSDGVHILTLDGNSILTLPAYIIKAKGWKKGDEIMVEINKKGDVILKKNR